MSPGVRPAGSAPAASAERVAAARGVAWGGVESLTAAGVGLLLTPYVVKSCGLEGLGLWAASWSLAHATNVLDLGIGASYTRFTSEAIARSDLGRLNRMLGAGIGFHLVLALAVLLLALLVGPAAIGIVAPSEALAAQAGTVFACTLFTVLLRTVLSVYRGVIAGAQRIDVLGRIGAVAALLEGIGAAAALARGWSLSGMAINSLFVGAGAALMEARAAHRLVPGLRVVPFGARRAEWLELLSFGLRLQLVRAAEILGAHAPRIALAAGAGLSAAGLYDLGARVAGLLQIASLPLPVIQPMAGRLWARAESPRVVALAGRATRYVALLALSASAVVLLDAPLILKAWTGQTGTAGAAAAARLLAAALLCGLLVSPLRLVLRGCGHPGPEALAALSGATLNVLAAVALAPLFGAIGVAGGALAGALLAGVILAVGARRIMPEATGAALLGLPAPIASVATGFAAAACARLLTGGYAAATRGEALYRLALDLLLLGTGTLLAGYWARAIRRDDLEGLAPAFLFPGARAPRTPAPAASGGRP